MESIQVLPHHFGMSVGDLDAAIDGFQKVLEFELDRKEDFLAAHGVHTAIGLFNAPGSVAAFILGPDGALVEPIEPRP